MSYTGCNQNSMYWGGQDRRNQRQDGSSSSEGYQAGLYQPQNGYQNQQNPQQPTTQALSQNVGAYGSQGYSSTGTLGNQHAMRGTYTTSQPDTTALGKLAYASRMVQNPSQEAVRQATAAYRQQDNTSYGKSNAYGASAPVSTGYGQQRTDRPSSTSTRAQQTTQPSSSQYQPTTTTRRPSYQSHPYVANNGRQSPAQPLSTTPQASRGTEQYRAPSHYAQPPRPSSGQALQRPNSAKSSLPTYSNPEKANTNHGSGAGHLPRYESGTQQVHSSSHGRNPSGSLAIQRSANTTPVSRAQNPSNVQSNNAEKLRVEKEAQQRAAGWNFPSSDAGSSADGSLQSNSQINQQAESHVHDPPVTVDPNQVFNDYEYQQKRHAEAEAARKKEKAAKAAKETAAQRTSNGQTAAEKALAASSQPSDVLQAAQAMMGTTGNGNADPDSAKKDQMELEMKQMIEKMRDYKAKDPSLFSQIWEQVKKVNGPLCYSNISPRSFQIQ